MTSEASNPKLILKKYQKLPLSLRLTSVILVELVVVLVLRQRSLACEEVSVALYAPVKTILLIVGILLPAFAFGIVRTLKVFDNPVANLSLLPFYLLFVSIPTILILTLLLWVQC